jgi:glyoxylase-like metal-dependent hydrolase (beta-lactamase superfamily II)
VADHPAALARLARGTGNLAGQITSETVWKPLPPGFDKARYETLPIHPTRRLRDGEQIELGGRTLEVILTHGHTPGSLSLLGRGRRLLLTGDTLYPAELDAHMPESNLAVHSLRLIPGPGLGRDVDYLTAANAFRPSTADAQT